jgi:alanine racemase
MTLTQDTINHKTSCSNWVEVDLSAIRGNIRYYLDHTQVQVMAVVKANAYGHGAVPVAKSVLSAGATWCAIARVEEALELRRAGIESPLLLLGYTPPDRYDEMIARHVSITIWDPIQINLASQAAERLGKTAHLHLKVDTGMSRLGVQAEQSVDLARALASKPGIFFEGVFTHFARADESDPTPSDLQEQRFNSAIQAMDAAGLRPPLVHAANSAAGLTRPSAYYNLIRPGIAIYGLHPSAECLLPSNFRPALQWKTVLSQVKTLPPGRGISYGHTYTTRAAERIGTLPVGYADGFRRTPGNLALAGGKRVPVVGRVCMDQVMVQLDGVPEAVAGDEVTLIGRQGDETLWAEELARNWRTINHEVVCGLTARVPRYYKD